MVPFPIALLMIVSLAFIIAFIGWIRVALRLVWKVRFCAFKVIFTFISYHSLIFTTFLSSDDSDSLNDEFDYDGSDSWSSGTYYFPNFSLRFVNSVGSVSGSGCIIFVPRGVKSKCDILRFLWLHNRSWIQRWSTRWNVLAVKFLVFFPNLKLSFIVIAMV